MPLYEFRCEKCRKKFTLKVSVTEYKNKRPACPKCKSRKVRAHLLHRGYPDRYKKLKYGRAQIDFGRNREFSGHRLA